MKKTYEKPVFTKTFYISIETIAETGYTEIEGYFTQQLGDSGCACSEGCHPEWNGICVTEASCCV